MTSFEPIQAGPYLLPSDPPDIAGVTKALADWAAVRVNQRYASTAARDAARPAPSDGEECVTGSGAALAKWIFRAGVGWGYVAGIGMGVPTADRVQADTAVLLITSGLGTISFTTPFLTVVRSVVASLGEASVSVGSAQPTAFSTSSLTSFQVSVLNRSGSALATGTIRVNWIAVGA